jgi:putative addiction module component (TIGR02574 family)
MYGMTKAKENILANALRLGLSERAELATELLASLDGPAESGAAAAWEAEIKRRVQALDAGTLELEPWDEVRRRIENELLGK